MSAVRYCGELRIRVTIVFRNGRDEYRCYIRPMQDENYIGATIFVGSNIQHGSGIGLDSPESFDSAAHAALSFAAEDGHDIESYAAIDAETTGWHISRKAATRWPVEQRF